MRLNPEIKASIYRFRQQKRAFYSLLILSALFLLTLPAELLCNSKPLIIRYDGRYYFPAFQRYTEQDFGGRRGVEPDYQNPRFLRLINCLPDAAESTDQPGTSPQPGAEDSILQQFDREPQDVERAPEPPASDDILQLFDAESEQPEQVSSAPDTAAGTGGILSQFDPEPGDVERRQGHDAARSERKAAADAECWILWPPVPYDYAYISTRSKSGRDALASPWGQVIPHTGKEYASSWEDRHYLGTDDRGRDVLARLVYGVRVSLVFGLALAVSSTIVGLILGALQGFFGGWIDLLGQRVTEIWGSLPQLYLLMILSSMLARNIYVLFVILNLTSWMGMAAYMRAEFLRGRNLDYVRAARSLGVANKNIMFRHILPNSLTPIITFFPFNVTGGILALVSLDFLGLGVPSPFPSLGELLSQGQANLHAIWIILPTFIVLSGAITLLTFIGDGLRNAFDPRKALNTT